MKEKIVLLIYQNNRYITYQDVTGFRADQIVENAKIKAEYGYECRVKRFPADYDVQARYGVNVFINEEVI